VWKKYIKNTGRNGDARRVAYSYQTLKKEGCKNVNILADGRYNCIYSHYYRHKVKEKDENKNSFFV
jgi:hypothetical protein